MRLIQARFHMGSAMLLLVVLAIGDFTHVSCETFEDRSTKQYDSAILPLKDNQPSIRQLLEYIHVRLNNSQGMCYIFFCRFRNCVISLFLITDVIMLIISISFSVGSRTFGQIKRFQTALLPIMYKLGVMSAIIFITLFLAMKGVFIGTMILIMNIAFFAAKIGGLFDKGHHGHGHGWSAHQSHGYYGLNKDVHLHIHNGKAAQYVPYSAPVWDASNQGGWSGYNYNSPPPAVHWENGRHLRNPDDIHSSSNDKSDTHQPFEIIYPSETSTKNVQVVTPYRTIKHYTAKPKS